MTRIRALATALAALVVRAVAPFRPEPGTTEGAVMLGLALLASGFAVAGLWPLALGVPGALLFAVGLGLDLRRRP